MVPMVLAIEVRLYTQEGYVLWLWPLLCLSIFKFWYVMQIICPKDDTHELSSPIFFDILLLIKIQYTTI